MKIYCVAIYELYGVGTFEYAKPTKKPQYHHIMFIVCFHATQLITTGGLKSLFISLFYYLFFQKFVSCKLFFFLIFGKKSSTLKNSEFICMYLFLVSFYLSFSGISYNAQVCFIF